MYVRTCRYVCTYEVYIKCEALHACIHTHTYVRMHYNTCTRRGGTWPLRHNGPESPWLPFLPLLVALGWQDVEGCTQPHCTGAQYTEGKGGGHCQMRDHMEHVQTHTHTHTHTHYIYGTWHKLLTWPQSFPHFFRAGFRESPRRHLQRCCTPSAYYPRGFCRRLYNGFVHFRLRWFQMKLGNSFGFWSIKRRSLLKMIFNLNLTFETKRIVFNRLRLWMLPKLKGFPNDLRMYRQASGDS